MKPAKFQCPHCGQLFRWKPELADKKVACKCGHKFRVPPTDPAAEQFGGALTPKPQDEALRALRDAGEDARPVELDDLDGGGGTVPLRIPEGFTGSSGGKCVACNSPLKPGAVICVNCGANQATGQKLRARIESLPPGNSAADANAARTMVGMHIVRAGLWCNLAGKALVVLGIAAGVVLAFLAGLEVAAMFGGILAIGGLGLQLLSPFLCLATPPEANARIWLVFALVGYIAAVAMSVLPYLTEDISPIVWAYGDSVESLAGIFFLLFFRKLAEFLEFQEIFENADKVLFLYAGLFLVQVIRSSTLYFLDASYGLGLFELILALYAFWLYITLLIDLSNALGYRIRENA